MKWVWLLVLQVVLALVKGQCTKVNVNWSNVTGTSKTITTLQVVANPILNPLTSPIAANCFQSLQNLNADLVRYVPWFPYPKVGVAELEPPTETTTSWNFTSINPQFDAFLAAILGASKGKSRVLPNFSTQPAWMYDTNDWSYPSDPNVVDWSYPQGNARSNTTELVAAYYARLLSWFIKGTFTDENGKVYTGGKKNNITHWEVFNEPEGCHGLDAQGYVQQYDAVVEAVRNALGPQHPIEFVGLALSGREIDWISYFLDPTNHSPGALPITWFSYHFYASSTSRTDPNTYTQFFSQARGFLPVAQQIMDLKNQVSPHTKIDIDEMGVILPDDNDPNAPVPPRLYWNAAGGYYAYLFGELSQMGYDVLGESQLAGSPPIPEWDIPDAQYPSVSMLNWTTGEGNARYWVLKLLIDNFSAGDKFVETVSRPVPTQEICGFVNGETMGYGDVSITCADSNAVINKIEFAAFGLPLGQCGNYTHNPKCDAKNATAVVEAMCLGKRSCSVLSYPTFGDPCYGTFKDFAIQATCTGSAGGWGVPAPGQTEVPYALGFLDGKTSNRKLLLVNRDVEKSCVTISGVDGAMMYVIDEATGDGPARMEKVVGNQVLLAPFAVAVVLMPTVLQ